MLQWGRDQLIAELAALYSILFSMICEPICERSIILLPRIHSDLTLCAFNSRRSQALRMRERSPLHEPGPAARTATAW